MKHRTLSATLLASLAVGGSAVLAAGCGSDGTASDSSDLTSKTQYVFLGEFVTADADYERWREIQLGLEDQFDEICGDTFCEGDWSNLWSLGFECSVSSKQGRIRECVWTFAASDEQIDGASGAISSRVPFFECRVRPTGTVKGLLPAFGDDPLHAELPGLGASLYDALGACFEEPIFVDDELPEPTDGAYVNASDTLDGADLDNWLEGTIALRQDFDDVCGDSFCEGDYTNLQALRFRCSSEETTGQIGECAWVFAGSYEERTSKGFITVEKAPFVCSFPVEATAAELAAALAPGAGEQAPIHRPLPNSDSSIYDALVDCL
jgi:hypothetical protein